MKRTVCFFFAVFLLLTSCRNKNENEIVVTQAFDNLLYLGLYVADEGGFFEQEGLKVKINTAGGDYEATSSLTSGNCHFALCDPAFAAIINEGGFDARVVGVVVNRAAFWGVTYNEFVDTITDMTQLKGKKIAVFPYPNTAYVIQKQLLENAGLEIGKDVDIVEVSYGSELATLKDGLVDIAQTLEPNVASVEHTGGKCVLSYPDFYGDIAFSGLIANKQYLVKNEEKVRRFIKAFNAAMTFIHEKPDESCKIAINHFSDMDSCWVSDAVLRLIESNSIGESTYVSQEAWNKLLDIRLAVKDIKKIPSGLIDNSYQK